MTASADIVTDKRPDSLGVPIQAVAVRTLEQLESEGKEGQKKRGEGAGAEADAAPATAAESRWKADEDGFVELVFVVRGDAVEARQVETGIQSDTHIEIVDGLAEGEEIVVGNYRALSKDLHDGSKIVKVPKAAEPAAEGAASS
jgi:HlyD family secretion protein